MIKDKDMHQKAKTANEYQDTQNIIKYLKSRKWSLSEVHKSIIKEQATQEEELITEEHLFY